MAVVQAAAGGEVACCFSMNLLRKISAWMEKPRSGSRLEGSRFLVGEDPTLGAFQYCTLTQSWTSNICDESGEKLMIRGRSRAPTEQQKGLLAFFRPMLPTLTADTHFRLDLPPELPRAILPDSLVLREVRFESNGEVELFFDPPLSDGAFCAWPMAVCSPCGEINRVEWTT
ncbi:MAG: hypothetical protein ACK5XN_29215 [Bacteroidota bacterium]